MFLTDALGRFTYPDGRSEEISTKAGDVIFMDATVHDPRATSEPRVVLTA
ncbi:MAG TPA: hypothetical protein VNO21_14990 [Polyangiaceae bacterium]|nr:hypothetical protein [Polyangiaceae bacterium]